MNKKWMPITAGVLDIISSVLGMFSGVAVGFILGFGWWGAAYGEQIITGLVTLIIVGALAIVGGVYAIRSKRWRLALAGAIAAFISCIPVIWYCCMDGFYILHDASISGPLWWAITLYLLIIIAVIIPIAAIILTVLSRKQFARQ